MSLLTSRYNNKTIHINEYTPNMKGKIFCNFCNESLIAKKGKIKAPHYSHKKNSNCVAKMKSHDMCDWHRYWQNICKKDYIEKKVVKDNVIKFADIVNKENLVIEIQHSKIQKDTIKSREEHYGNMIWLFDCKQNNTEIAIICKDNVCVFKTSFNSIGWALKPVYIDTKYGIYRVLEFRKGYLICEKISHSNFMNKYFSDILASDSSIKSPEYEELSLNESIEYDTEYKSFSGNDCYNHSNNGDGVFRKMDYRWSYQYKCWIRNKDDKNNTAKQIAPSANCYSKKEIISTEKKSQIGILYMTKPTVYSTPESPKGWTFTSFTDLNDMIKLLELINITDDTWLHTHFNLSTPVLITSPGQPDYRKEVYIRIECTPITDKLKNDLADHRQLEPISSGGISISAAVRFVIQKTQQDNVNITIAPSIRLNDPKGKCMFCILSSGIIHVYKHYGDMLVAMKSNIDRGTKPKYEVKIVLTKYLLEFRRIFKEIFDSLCDFENRNNTLYINQIAYIDGTFHTIMTKCTKCQNHYPIEFKCNYCHGL